MTINDSENNNFYKTRQRNTDKNRHMHKESVQIPLN